MGVLSAAGAKATIQGELDEKEEKYSNVRGGGRLEMGENLRDGGGK